MSPSKEVRIHDNKGRKRRRITVFTTPQVDLVGSRLEEVADVRNFFSNAWQEKALLRYKMFLLQAFLFHFLETQEEVEVFFAHVHKLIEGSGECFTAFSKTEAADYTLLEKVLQTDSAFLFSVVNSMPKGTSVTAYSRSEDNFVNKYFPGCGEAMLLGLICNLLYDSIKEKYMADHLPKGRLRGFFETYASPFMFTT